MRKYQATVIAVLIGIFSVPASEGNELLKELDATNQAFAKAILEKNIDHLVGDYTDGACVFAPAAPRTCGLDAIRSFWIALANTNPKDVKIETLAAGSSGSLAYATGILRITDASETTHENNFVLVLKDIDGTWKIHLDTWTPR